MSKKSQSLESGIGRVVVSLTKPQYLDDLRYVAAAYQQMKNKITIRIPQIIGFSLRITRKHIERSLAQKRRDPLSSIPQQATGGPAV